MPTLFSPIPADDELARIFNIYTNEFMLLAAGSATPLDPLSEFNASLEQHPTQALGPAQVLYQAAALHLSLYNLHDSATDALRLLENFFTPGASHGGDLTAYARERRDEWNRQFPADSLPAFPLPGPPIDKDSPEYLSDFSLLYDLAQLFGGDDCENPLEHLGTGRVENYRYYSESIDARTGPPHAQRQRELLSALGLPSIENDLPAPAALSRKVRGHASGLTQWFSSPAVQAFTTRLLLVEQLAHRWQAVEANPDDLSSYKALRAHLRALVGPATV